MGGLVWVELAAGGRGGVGYTDGMACAQFQMPACVGLGDGRVRTGNMCVYYGIYIYKTTKYKQPFLLARCK